MEQTSPNPAISIRGVRRAFGGRSILNGIDLEVQKGEFFALVGPSGSGKSTLLKMVSGIDQPTAGEVWLEGENVTRVPPYRRAVHTVFQNYALFPHLSVAGNVGFPLKVAGLNRAESDKRVAKALALVKLDAFASRAVTTLSGGERQRVAVARALVDEPRCILFDEPLSALDPHLRVATLEMIEEIQERLKITYLYVTHDRQEALRAAHRVAVLRDGKLEQVGTPTELYHRPTTPFVASFLGPINWLPAERLEQNGKMVAKLAGGAEVALRSEPHECGYYKPELPNVKQLSIGLRPEDVRIDSRGPVEARVIGCEFCGATSHVRLEIAGGTHLVADVRGPLPDLARGSAVRITWDDAKIHVFAVGPDCQASVQELPDA